MSHETRVEPDLLRRVAGDVDALRDEFDQAGGDIEATAGELAQRMAGWQLARRSEDNSWALRDDAKAISDRLEQYATALRTCARDYQHTDRVSAETLALFPKPWDSPW